MKRIAFALIIFASVMLLAGCASLKLDSIPKPQLTTKLRVAVLPLTEVLNKGNWGKSIEEFTDQQYKLARKQLDIIGYYEVVPESEVMTVLGGYVPTRATLFRNDADQAYQIGKALYADYLLLIERGTLGDPHYFFDVTMFNIESGKRFSVKITNTRERGGKKLPKGTAKIALRELFHDAKEDMLSTALRKIGRVSEDQHKSRQNQEARIGISADVNRSIEYEESDTPEEPGVSGAKRLIVYDFAAFSDIYRPVALILSEALREEIQSRGGYNLVNRENILQLLDEIKFQQSGLVDNSQTVELGKVAGANEIITGNVGALGTTVVLQSKRTDIQTMLNLSQASLKSVKGEEELLLNRLSKMTDQLLENRKSDTK